MKFNWDEDRTTGENIAIALVTIILTLGIAFGLMCLTSWLLMLLWNSVVVAVFGASTITFWQTFGLYLIIWLVFKGIGKLIPVKKDEEDY